MTMHRVRFACWITKATDTYSEYVILIAFPRQKWLRERALTLRYAYIAFHVVTTYAFRYVSQPKRCASLVLPVSAGTRAASLF